MRRIGQTQAQVLRQLRERGNYPDGGWVVVSPRITMKLISQLVVRGYVSQEPAPKPTYRITESGRAELVKHQG